MGNSVLGSIVGAMLLLGLGTLIAFAGYRLFLVLLPIYGFLFGITFGAHSVQALFGDGVLSTATSWVVGFFVGLLFAVLSYLFWVVAVAIMAGSFGYALVAGLFGLFGADLDVLTWIVGVAVGVAFAIAALVLNLQKAIVIVASAAVGAWGIVGTFLLVLGITDPEALAEGGPKVALDDNPLWIFLFLVLVGLGIGFQFATTRGYEVERYQRLSAQAATEA